ncbi:MAG: acetoacetyl-CoA reductase [Gammaproteobacteria bacterium]
MQIKLDGRVALITGASGTIGRQICAYLGRAGAQVVGACAPPDMPAAAEVVAQARAEGRTLEFVPFDVSVSASASAAIEGIEAKHGHIDILVNVAGITRDAPMRRMTAEQWQAVLNVNLNSVFNCSKPVAEGMAKRGWGRIVSISSVNGQRGQYGQVNYSASKAGLHGFTMALAQEMARKGVTVNTVAPGYVDSPMVNAVPEEVRARILANIPMGHFGQATDIAAAVTFLCSTQAAYITGAQLPVNGGFYFSA